MNNLKEFFVKEYFIFKWKVTKQICSFLSKRIDSYENRKLFILEMKTHKETSPVEFWQGF